MDFNYPLIGYIIIVFVILYFLIARSKQHTVLSLILITLWGIVIFAYLYKFYNVKKIDDIKTDLNIEKKNDNRKLKTSANSPSYYVKNFSNKPLKYLMKNNVLLEIIEDIKFTKVFDNARYNEILLLMEKMQKIYTYILGNRYEPNSYIPILVDISDLILEKLYSFYIVVPVDTKHMYGLKPHDVLNKNITRFISLRRKMLNIVNKYTKKVTNVNYTNVNSDLPRAADVPLKNNGINLK